MISLRLSETYLSIEIEIISTSKYSGGIHWFAADDYKNEKKKTEQLSSGVSEDLHLCLSSFPDSNSGLCSTKQVRI